VLAAGPKAFACDGVIFTGIKALSEQAGLLALAADGKDGLGGPWSTEGLDERSHLLEPGDKSGDWIGAKELVLLPGRGLGFPLEGMLTLMIERNVLPGTSDDDVDGSGCFSSG
jgi:hypothetical protein